VMFTDLVGSTALSTKVDLEDMRSVIGAYHRCVAETVARFDAQPAAPGPPVLRERGVPMFLRRVTRPRLINNTGKMQEGRVSEIGGRDTNSDVNHAPPNDSPRVKPSETRSRALLGKCRYRVR
jgi:hypothetical protein